MSLKYTAVRLGDFFVPQGINENNLVVGYTYSPTARMRSLSQRAFVWSDGTGTQIDTGQPSANSQANGVGENNVIVGQGAPGQWGVYGFVEDNGVVTRLEGLGGTNVMPAATNGTVHVGQATLPNRVARPVKWENGKCVDLGTLGGPAGAARAINGKGTIVGASRTNNANFEMSGFIVVDGKMSALPGLPGAKTTWAYGVSSNDVAVGSSDWKAVKWVKDKPVELCPGAANSVALDANAQGFVVGQIGGTVAFIHDGQKYYNLNELTEGLNGLTVSSATSINDSNYIAATGMDSKFQLYGLLLIPS